MEWIHVLILCKLASLLCSVCIVWVFACVIVWSESEMGVWSRQCLLNFGAEKHLLGEQMSQQLSELGLLRPGDPGSACSVTPKAVWQDTEVGQALGHAGQASPHRPAVPPIMLAKVLSLDSKIDYIRLLRASLCSICNYWLNDNIRNTVISRRGFYFTEWTG